MQFFKSLFITLFLLIPPLFSAEVVTDNSTAKVFPKNISFTYDKAEYTLNATGTTTLTKFFVNTYSITSYLQNPVYGARDYLFKQAFDESRAKALILIYVIDVNSVDLQKSFRDDFQKTLTKDEYQKLKEDIDKFVGFFTKEVSSNDQIIFIWLPDGSLLVNFDNKRMPPIKNSEFAKALWGIWLGPKAIVNRAYLVQNYKTD